jgi:signal transduction histidine kinase
MSAKPAPFARARIDSLLGRMFAICAVLLSFDLISNALMQYKLLNPVWFWPTFVAVTAAQLGTVVGAFVFDNPVIWYRAMVFTTLFTLLTWNLQTNNVAELSETYKPWVWWAIGFSSLATVGAFKRTWVSLVFLFLMPLVWLLIRTSPAGGATSWSNALQDSLYSFFFSTSVGLLVMALRLQVDRVDQAHSDKLRSAARAATIDAIERERVRINSIAHDKVLSTLALAVLPDAELRRDAAASAAQDAIARLQREQTRVPDGEAPVSSTATSEAIEQLIASQTPQFKVKTKIHQDVLIAFDQAAAIAEATVQAALNSVEHAPAAERTITITSTISRFKVVVFDDGPGFHISNLRRDNLGVRLAIQKRLKAFGVDVKLDSTGGTTWIFEVRHNA